MNCRTTVSGINKDIIWAVGGLAFHAYHHLGSRIMVGPSLFVVEMKGNKSIKEDKKDLWSGNSWGQCLLKRKVNADDMLHVCFMIRSHCCIHPSLYENKTIVSRSSNPVISHESRTRMRFIHDLVGPNCILCPLPVTTTISQTVLFIHSLYKDTCTYCFFIYHMYSTYSVCFSSFQM